MDLFLSILKALHLISIIAWMGGLLYLPRLFVYHSESEPGSLQSETFKVMERRLFWGIMNPAMFFSFLFGLALIICSDSLDWYSAWIWIKVICIGILTMAHMQFGMWQKAFEADANVHSAKTYRIVNEIPTILMIMIVLMVIIKPF